jgi:hypothetical protein
MKMKVVSDVKRDARKEIKLGRIDESPDDSNTPPAAIMTMTSRAM